MFNPFTIRRAAHCPLAGFAPIGNGLDRPASVLQVMSNHFGNSGPFAVVLREESIGDPGVQQLSRRAQQCAVGGLLH